MRAQIQTRTSQKKDKIKPRAALAPGYVALVTAPNFAPNDRPICRLWTI
jgi:hypothetical protein